ncbi:hypothetical protein [Paraburkholderia caffeinilytica]|uniref:hypothetical protein n=1 Tax=Paraburkholderia caffeinilytica TaxID=1761016 RepID=UPI0038BA421B
MTCIDPRNLRIDVIRDLNSSRPASPLQHCVPLEHANRSLMPSSAKTFDIIPARRHSSHLM